MFGGLYPGGATFFHVSMQGSDLSEHLDDLVVRLRKAASYQEYKLSEFHKRKSPDLDKIAQALDHKSRCEHFAMGYEKLGELLSPAESYDMSLVELDMLCLVEGPHDLLVIIEKEMLNPVLDM